MKKQIKPKSELLTLMNVGPAMVHDLQLMDITTIEQLAQQTADDLFARLEAITKTKQNPCVYDVLVAITHEARTGEKVPWWYFSPFRPFGKTKSKKQRA